MGADEQESFGKKIEYDPLWKGPMEKERVRTDFSFFTSFIVFTCLWIVLGIYAFVFGDTGDIDRKDELNTKLFLESAKIGLSFTIVAAILSLAFIILLRWFAKIMVYASLAVFCIILIGLICLSVKLYSMSSMDSGSLTSAIVLSIILVITVVCIVIFYKKINIACEVIREASKAVMFFPSSFAFPILPSLLYIIATVYFSTVSVYLTSIKNFDNTTPVHINVFHIINLFGWLWVLSFVTGFAQMTLSGTYATWYWSLHKNYVPKHTILRFMRTTIKYHLGTIALGSLIISICQLINILLSSIKKRLQGNGNPIACCFLGWYKFLFENLERFLKLIGRNAYIMSAVHGTGFMQSAKDAFNLFMRNIVKVLVINNVTDTILFLGQLISVGITLLITYLVCGDNETLIPYILTVVLVCSLLIAATFFMVLRTAIDTIFLCVMEDFERNDGSNDRPYYMSFKLKSLLFKDEYESA